ncbi:DEAD/DEAH box helicase [Actinoalloteichus fjordicus]|uniref:DNA/RNA helicase, superfamily II n=1 Tax=Actinoalloteichus fjordicus TaxID=1612552 RepID=A0AAC9PR97_9PSEU|nr:DNA/RNA helicase, superfamily II [Actinoalloteichus fjordicus]APU19844.1 DNA/RNA helicase, superfamily II [Actinoalloteichus sp. GBA129-24]
MPTTSRSRSERAHSPRHPNEHGRGGDGARHGSGRRRPRRETRPQQAVSPLLHSALEATAPLPTGPMPSFTELGLPEALVRTLSEKGITEPFPIQAATLPDVLAQRDVLGRGQTGSGKTLAFGLPMLTRLKDGQTAPLRPRGLILVPTRELAMQVHDALEPFAHALRLRTTTVVGGTSFPRQTAALRRGVDLLIATPGRLSDHVRQGTCQLDDVMIATLDEADQMADMGFLPQVRAILDLVKPGGQRLLFSATLDREVGTLVREYLTDPVVHAVAPPSASVTTMEHHLLLVSADDKPDVLAGIGAREGRTIMFVRTKHTADRVAKKLRSVGVRAGALHGGKTQNARTRTLGEFREGSTPVLVATDVAARGIHVDDVSLVVHVDPPADPKDYLHRAGRTARAGESGVVVTLVLNEQRRSVTAMTNRAGVRAKSTRVRPGDEELSTLTGARTPSGEPVAEPRPERQPRPRRAGAPGGRGRGGAGAARSGGFRGGERRDRGQRENRANYSR